jgi:hypothetical protein
MSYCNTELCNAFFNVSSTFSLKSILFCTCTFRNVVSSSAGVRVVEVRDKRELVLSSWQFLESDGVQEFTLPPDVMLERSLILIAEDSAGNILRYNF